MARDTVLHGSGSQSVLVSATHPVRAKDIQPQGWTLKRPPGGTPENLGGDVRPPPPPPRKEPLPYFRPKYVIFPTLFQTKPLPYFVWLNTSELL